MFRGAASKLELLLRSPAPPPGGFLPLLFTLPPAGSGAQQGGEMPGGGMAHAGVKRAREGPGAGVSDGPRKGGPGPRPMTKQLPGEGGVQSGWPAQAAGAARDVLTVQCVGTHSELHGAAHF